LLAEALAFVHARLKELVEGPVKTWNVVEGVGRVIRVIDGWG
jgi:hypothetical protein